MKIETCDKILFLIGGLMIGLLITGIIYSTWFYQIPYSIKFKVNGYTKENAIAICSGKNLKRTALCLHSFISGIYKYKSRKDSETPSFTEIITEGGDCKNWEELICELANQIGYRCEKTTLFVEKEGKYKIYHTFPIIYNEKGYFRIDGKDMNLFLYKR